MDVRVAVTATIHTGGQRTARGHWLGSLYLSVGSRDSSRACKVKCLYLLGLRAGPVRGFLDGVNSSGQTPNGGHQPMCCGPGLNTKKKVN